VACTPCESHMPESHSSPPKRRESDKIIQSVRACPSGALSHAIDGVEAHNQVHQACHASIEVAKDGPYRVTGGVPIVDEHVQHVPQAEGSSPEHYSMCRCGQSQNRPFCSGIHWYVKFTDLVPAAEHEPTLFEWAGRFPSLLRMTRIFYGKYVPQRPLIGPVFAEVSPGHPERGAAWLCEAFNGPRFYSERYGGYSRMISQHVGKCINEKQRSSWVKMLCQSADDAMLPNDPEFRTAFVAHLEWVRASARKTRRSTQCLRPTCRYRGCGGYATRSLVRIYCVTIGNCAGSRPGDVAVSLISPACCED
jgi:truncated hemoglobin YjbI